MNVSELGTYVGQSARLGLGTGDRLRLIRQFIADVESAANPQMLLDDRPPTSGDRRWDALIAGVVEDTAFRIGLRVPSWTTDPCYQLSEWWFVTSVAALRPTAFVETPAAIANRGVFIRRASLVNI